MVNREVCRCSWGGMVALLAVRELIAQPDKVSAAFWIAEPYDGK